jgi:hypothetical protein
VGEVTGRTELCSVERRCVPSLYFINYYINLCELKFLVRFLFLGGKTGRNGWSRLDLHVRVGIEWAGIAQSV